MIDFDFFKLSAKPQISFCLDREDATARGKWGRKKVNFLISQDIRIFISPPCHRELRQTMSNHFESWTRKKIGRELDANCQKLFVLLTRSSSGVSMSVIFEHMTGFCNYFTGLRGKSAIQFVWWSDYRVFSNIWALFTVALTTKLGFSDFAHFNRWFDILVIDDMIIMQSQKTHFWHKYQEHA